MSKKTPSFIRIHYNRQTIFLLAGVSTALILLLLALVLSSSNIPDPRNYIFFLNLAPTTSNNQPAPSPMPPSPDLTPTEPASGGPTPPLVTPIKLNTSDANLAEVKTKEALDRLKAKSFPSSAVESYYQQGRVLLENEQEEEALEKFRLAYDLAQEILLAGEYYLK